MAVASDCVKSRSVRFPRASPRALGRQPRGLTPDYYGLNTRGHHAPAGQHTPGPRARDGLGYACISRRLVHNNTGKPE